MNIDPSDGSVDSSPAHSPCTEWPRNLASLSSRRVLLRSTMFLPRRARRSSAASSAPRAVRQSLQQSIPNVSPTATNRVSPKESSLCTSPTPIVANDSADLFKLTHGGGASSSRLPVCRLDGDLAAANSRSVPISVDGVAEVRSTISSFFRPMLAIVDSFLFLSVSDYMQITISNRVLYNVKHLLMMFATWGVKQDDLEFMMYLLCSFDQVHGCLSSCLYQGNIEL